MRGRVQTVKDIDQAGLADGGGCTCVCIYVGESADGNQNSNSRAGPDICKAANSATTDR